MTREQIIDLINQYIYTNGNQRITAAQLNEILLEIANAFALEGGGEATGIDSVLEAGNQVTEGRTIVNENGGTVVLAGDHSDEGDHFKYIGFEALDTAHQTFDYLTGNQVVIGSLKRSNPSRNLFNMLSARLKKEEVVAMTTYISETPDYQPGVYSSVMTEATVARDNMTAGSAEQTVTYILEPETGARQRVEIGEITHSVVQGPQSSEHFQDLIQIRGTVTNGDAHFDSILYPTKQLWANQAGAVAEINNAGIRLESGKSVELFPTGGTATRVALTSASGGGTLKVDGMASLTLDSYITILKASTQIQFVQSSTTFGSFSSAGSTLNSPFTMTNAVGATAFSSTHSTPGGNNVAVYANSINGITNTAILADNGNLVVKNGYAMVGFGSDITPNARVDIKTLGPTFGDLGLRVRNSTDTYSILEVRGDGEVQCSTTNDSSASIRANNSGGGDNIGIQVNSYNGTTNTALLAVSGNVVTQTGSAMFGFGPGNVTPEARVDVKAQGATAADLALRIRNSAGTDNILEVRGDGDVLLGTGLLTAGTGLGSTLLHGFSIDGCRVDSDMEYQGTDQYNYGRIHLRGTDFDTEGTNVINIANGTAPATDNADAFRFYSADQVAGNAVPHFRTENGAVVKIYQETTAVGDATLASGSGTPLTDTDTFDGYTLKQIVKALRNLGLLD